jgi:hypothetical protein
MKTKMRPCALGLFLGLLVLTFPARFSGQSAPSSGQIEFVAQVTPSGGQPEPVRQMTFYLLRKSVEDIRADAAQSAPAADLDKFIDGLGVSPELKAWMHKHHSLRLNGEDFTKSLTPEDIVGVHEFFKAYMDHNEAYRGIGFPQPKYNDKEKISDPEKYKAQKELYEAAIRRFIAGHMDTIQGIDLDLLNVDPYVKWEALERKRNQNLDTRAFQLAQERYLVARAETNLDGRGSFSGVAPGKYWIGMLGTEAISGDVRLHWDFPVTVRPGQTASIELSNLNAARPSTTAQNSDN